MSHFFEHKKTIVHIFCLWFCSCLLNANLLLFAVVVFFAAVVCLFVCFFLFVRPPIFALTVVCCQLKSTLSSPITLMRRWKQKYKSNGAIENIEKERKVWLWCPNGQNQERTMEKAKQREGSRIFKFAFPWCSSTARMGKLAQAGRGWGGRKRRHGHTSIYMPFCYLPHLLFLPLKPAISSGSLFTLTREVDPMTRVLDIFSQPKEGPRMKNVSELEKGLRCCAVSSNQKGTWWEDRPTTRTNLVWCVCFLSTDTSPSLSREGNWQCPPCLLIIIVLFLWIVC
jgi:hypothetical protein